MRILVSFATILLLAAPWARCATRIAIIADEASQPVADLLTAKLSGDKDLVLVERAEVDKALREWKRSTDGNLQNELSLASMLHADGIVMLESQTVQGKPAVGARLVAIGPGAVIGADLFGGMPDEVADHVASGFHPLWSKLAVKRESAIPVSLLNLRFALKGSEPVETQLTFLVAHQLMRQRELFVLERWRMDDLTFEKGFSTWNEGVFWNGSYVVDGRIDFTPDGKLKVTAFLRPPGKTAAEQIETTGAKEDLPKLAGDLATKITQSLTKHPDTGEWKGADESGQYFNEAKWAFGARLYPAAKAAAESSLALGNHGPELLYLRTQIYSALAYPPEQYQAEGPGRVTPGHPYRQGYDVEEIDVSQGEQHVRAAMLGLECFHEYAAANPGRGEKYRTVQAGATALMAASRVLRNYFDRGLIPGHDTEALEELRGEIRETAGIVLALDDLPVPTRGEYGANYTKFGYMVEVKYLQFWSDTPAQAMEAYRTMLDRHPDLLFEYLWSRDWRASIIMETYNMPWLVGWKGESPAELQKVWDGFLDSLEKSGKPAQALNGAFLRLQSAKTTVEKEDAAAHYHDLLWDNRDELFKNGREKVYMHCLNLIRPPKEYYFPWILYTLKHEDAFDPVLFGEVWHTEALTPEQGAEAYRELQAFRDRMAAAGKLTGMTPRLMDAMERQLLGMFPEIKPVVSSARKLEISRHWQPPGGMGMLGTHFIWRENKLWVAFSNPLPETSGGEKRYRIKLCALDIPSFTAGESIEMPPGKEIYSSIDDPFYYITPTSVYLYDYDRFLRYNRKSGAWSNVSLPEKRYSSFFARGDDLFVAFSKRLDQDTESSILKWSGATGKQEVIASNRRRPGLHQFDDCPAYSVDGLCGGLDGKIGVQIGKFYWHQPGTAEWKQPFSPDTVLEQLTLGNVDLLVSSRNGVAAVDNDTGKMTVLTGSHFEGSPGAAVYLPAAMVSERSLSGVRIIPYGTAYADGSLWTIRRGGDNGRDSVILNRTERVDQPPSALSDIGLAFKQSEAGGNNATRLTTEGPLIVSDAFDLRLAATSHGLVFKITGTDGLWFMPKEDFDAFLAAPSKDSNAK